VSGEIRVVFAEDHPFFRDGLRTALSAVAGIRIIGEAGDGAEALALIDTLRPDVSILDISLPVADGVSVVRRLREQRIATEVIFLTVHDDADMFEEALELGVKGYLLKDCTSSELARCVKTVAAGQHYTTAAVTTYLIGKTRGIERLAAQVPGLGQLTPQERTILRLIAQLKSSKEIAKDLGIAAKTVDAHRTNICAKLDVHGTHALTRFAIRHRSAI
jgi:DNA-binding NarL/FixJ family response regulator